MPRFTADSVVLCLVAALLLVADGASSATAALPAAIDTPQAPAGVESPGGNGLPEMNGSAVADAPAISAVGDLTFADETLVVCGDRLEGAALRLWAEGQTRDIKPLRSAADRMLAVLPDDIPASTLLVWPMRDGKAGAPIRVNGPTVWWSFPPRASAGRSGQTIRLMGKGLSLAGFEPRVYLEGPGRSGWLDVTLANLYELHAELPADLAPGRYTVRAHNGSGGPLGWSEPTPLEVIEFPATAKRPTFRVDDFGARPDDDADDTEAIQAAFDAAGKAGGGTVLFSAGTYHLAEPIHTPADVPDGLAIVGAGRGRHTPKTHALEGTFTCLRWLQGEPFPEELLRVRSRFTTIRGLNFYNAADGAKQLCVSLRAFDCRVEDSRFVVFERLPEVPVEKRKRRLIDNGALHVEAPGKSNTVIENCDFHTPGAGIQLGVKRALPSTDYVRISDCLFRGYFSGVYKPGRRRGRPFVGPAESGYRACAMTNDCGKYTIVEGCAMAGADRVHGLVMGRALQCHSSTVRGQFWARNAARHVANHSSLGEVNRNMGEQYMFHTSHEDGGLFDVIEADATHIIVDPSNPKYEGKRLGRLSRSAAGSLIPDDVAEHGHYVCYVCAGKGVGQYRIVADVERSPQRVALRMDRPWRVVPDATSRVVVKIMYRQNIVYDCLADTGKPDTRFKSHGVIFWYDSVNNIVADNTFRNLTAGAVFNHAMRANTLWNMTRGNRMENMEGFTGDTSVAPAFYVNHYRPYTSWPDRADRIWYSVGEICRDNVCRDSEAAAAYLHTRYLRPMKNDDRYVPHPEGGIMLGVVENNTFQDVARGVIVSSPANWSLIRNNQITTTDPAQPEVFDETLGEAVDDDFYLRIE